ncbi:MAG: M23 family metallopeptidase [Spirochaetaceae bacterium]|nr:M23 family metallopeptidase [Spirochaetaceae bacterium]
MAYIRLPLPLLLLWFISPLSGAEDFPVIQRMEIQDTAFKQYLFDVETARRRAAGLGKAGGESPASLAEALTVYAYTPRAADDILGIAARCAVPYASIATLNRIARQGALDTGRALLLPSAPGLFIPEAPGSGFEELLAASRTGDPAVVITLNRNGAKERFRFIPGADFTPTERAFFLHPGFGYPLRSYRITSAFGPRINPVTGIRRNHNGLDLAAPAGTEVYAAKAGVVAETGEDRVYGKYIIIQHDESWISLYGHLSRIDTALRRRVESGTLIGRVGSTGQSTGAHLHFELRRHGKAQDPGKYLSGVFAPAR